MVLSSTRKAGKQINPESEKWLKHSSKNKAGNFIQTFFSPSKYKGRRWVIFSSDRVVPTEMVAPPGTRGSKLHASLKRQQQKWFL